MKLASLDRVSAAALQRLNDSRAPVELQLTPSIVRHRAAPPLCRGQQQFEANEVTSGQPKLVRRNVANDGDT